MLTKQFRRYNDMENSQLTLGYYNELPFLSMSPVFEAQKGRDLSKLPLQEGEKIFNHDNKIFFQLDLGDLIKISEGLKMIQEEEIISFSLVHRGMNGKSLKVLEIGLDDEGGFGAKLSNKTEEGTNVILFSFESFSPEQAFIKVKDTNGKVSNFEFSIYISEFEEFIEKSKYVALKIAAPTDSKNNQGSYGDDDGDEMSSPFTRTQNSYRPNSNRKNNGKPRSFISRRSGFSKDESTESNLPPRKPQKVETASDVFDSED